MEVFGTRLKELRKEQNISQAKLAQEIHYSQSVICDWENGKVEPTVSAIIAVADYFNVCADYLLGRKDFY